MERPLLCPACSRTDRQRPLRTDATGAQIKRGPFGPRASGSIAGLPNAVNSLEAAGYFFTVALVAFDESAKSGPVAT